MKQSYPCGSSRILTVIAILQLLLAAPVAGQTPPPLDSSFGRKGAAFLNLYDSLIGFGQIHDYVFDSAGNAYVLLPRWMNMTNAISDGDAIVAKFTPAGILDSGFNGMGYAVVYNHHIDLQTPDRASTFVRVSNDGSNTTIYSNFYGTVNMYRLTKEGRPDHTHGVKGYKNIDLPTRGALTDIRKTADNGVWLLQSYLPGSTTVKYSVAKLDAEDNVDPSFVPSGVVLQINTNTPLYEGSVPLGDGGMLVTVGKETSSDELYSLSWIKFKSNGVIDSGYGVNGVAETVLNIPMTLDNTVPSVHSILLPDHSVLTMVLRSDSYYTHDIYQIKTGPSGVVDSSFGHNGINITSIGYLNAFIGRYTDPGDLNFWADRTVSDSAGYVSMRVRPSGYIDSTYIHTSRTNTAFYNAGYRPQFASDAWVTDQHITGARSYDNLQNTGTLIIARLDPQANAVAGYGTGGKALFTDGVSDDQLLAIAPLPDGRMVGVSTDGVQERLFRVTTDGRLDKRFGNGKTLVPLDSSHYTQASYAYVSVDAKGRVVVIGPHSMGSTVDETVVSRYTADGIADPSFGQGGYVAVNNLINTNVPEALEYHGAALQADNKVLLLCRHVSGIPQKSVVGVLRLNENGTVDNTFGSNGWANFNYSFDLPELITVLHNGNILVSATYQDASRQYVAELSPSGQLQTKFGTDGFAFTIQGTLDDHVFYLGETDSGKIVYAATGRDYTTNVFTLAGRLNSDLSYDTSAGISYWVGDHLSSCVLLHDGRLVLTGMHNSPNTPAHLAMTVTKKDLRPDSTFGDDGFLTYPDILPDSLVQVNPYSTLISANQGATYNQIIAFRDANGEIVTAATAKKDSLGDIFLLRTLFNDTSRASTQAPPQPLPTTGSLVLWAPAFCSGQSFIGLALYDTTGAIIQMPGTTSRLVTTLGAPPVCNGSGGYTYTAGAGNYTLKAYCGADSIVAKVTIFADSCISHEVIFPGQPAPPHDSTPSRPPNDTTNAPNQIIVAPNPTRGMADIRLPGTDNGSLLAADMTGRVVLRMEFSGADIKLDVTRLEKGYYLLWIKGAKYSRTLTVLKL